MPEPEWVTPTAPTDAAGALDRIAAIRREHRARWLRGERVPVEDYLRGVEPAVGADSALVLIHGEYLLRQELGEAPALEEYLDGAQQCLDAFLGPTPELPVPFFERMAAPPAHRRQELVVHLDQVIEQCPVRFHQKTGQEGIPRGWPKPLQRLRVIFAGKLIEVKDQMRMEATEVDFVEAAGTQQLVAFEVG